LGPRFIADGSGQAGIADEYHRQDGLIAANVTTFAVREEG
jgi:hypothetical protein